MKKKYDVKFFEIGNEPFIWHKVHFDVRRNPCSAQEYFNLFKEIALAMKKAQHEIDPQSTIKIFAPGVSTSYINWETLSLETDGRHAIEYFLQECRNFEQDRLVNPEGFRILDVLSFHLFPSLKESLSGNFEEDATKILASTQNWWNPDYINSDDAALPKGAVARVIPKFRQWIEENYPGTKLALSEFNLEAQSMVDYPPILKVLYLSDLYGILARYGVDYALQFCLNSSDQHTALVDETDAATCLYYPFALFANNFKSVSLDTSSSDPEALSAYACASGQDIVVMAINKTNSASLAAIEIIEDGKVLPKSFYYAFAPLSVTYIKVPPQGWQIECWKYGAENID